MSKEKEAGRVIESLVKEYKAIVSGNESAIRAFIKSAHKTPARDLEATLKEAFKSGAIYALRPSYANYFDLGNTCLSIVGSDKVSVNEFMKIVCLCQKALGKEQSVALVARVSNWVEFEEAARKADKAKPKRNNGRKGKKTEAKSNYKDLVTADAVISMALGQLKELDGDNALIRNFEQLEALEGFIKTMKANSRAVASKHAVVSAKANA